MSAEAPPECQEMLDMGATLVLREVEDSWGAIQKDAYDGRLRPMYTFLPPVCTTSRFRARRFAPSGSSP
jgi:hypothetical protein